MSPHSPGHEMLPYLVDLESPYEAEAQRPYDPVDLVRYALATSDYWADLALLWLEQGVPSGRLESHLAFLETRTDRSQPVRHRAREMRKRAQISNLRRT